MLSDPIADMLTRIRNGYMAKKQTVSVPFSKVKEAIAKVLTENKYLENVEVIEEGKKKFLSLTLSYSKGKPAITTIKRISTNGRQIYVKKDKLPYVLSGLGKAIVSTSAGVMTADTARRQALGGEVICHVW